MDIGGPGDVGPDEQRPCAAGFDLACHTVAAFGTASSDDHLSSFPGERQRGGAADPELPPVTGTTLSFISQTYAEAPSPVLPRRPQLPNPAAWQTPQGSTHP
jgi:hypothetical protein